MKHTKGPWRIGDAGHTVFGPPTGNPSPETVATLAKSESWRSNARLIAAAPELLEALELVSKWFQDYGSAPLHGSALLTDSDEPISEVLRAAIAKATT